MAGKAGGLGRCRAGCDRFGVPLPVVCGCGVPCVARGAGLVPGPWVLPPGAAEVSGVRAAAGRPRSGCGAALRPEGGPYHARHPLFRPVSGGLRPPPCALLFPRWLRRPGRPAVPPSPRPGSSSPVPCAAGRSAGPRLGQPLRAVRGQVAALGEVLAQQPVGVLVRRPRHGECGSQKKISQSAATAICRCRAISLPWSQVSDGAARPAAPRSPGSPRTRTPRRSCLPAAAPAW